MVVVIVAILVVVMMVVPMVMAMAEDVLVVALMAEEEPIFSLFSSSTAKTSMRYVFVYLHCSPPLAVAMVMVTKE